MALSRREQIIGLVTAGVIGLMIVDHFALSPLLERRAQAQTQISTLTGDQERAEQLITNAPRMRKRWNDMLASGLKSDETDSKNQALTQLLAWEKESGVTFTSLQPERGDLSGKAKELQPIMLRATASGSMRSISQFLWKVHTSDIPMRVIDLQIDSHKPGSDDLVLTLSVSTLAVATEVKR